jgi:hypothetical protein
MEFATRTPTAELRLTTWPGDGTHQVLAKVHPHGAVVEWL